MIFEGNLIIVMAFVLLLILFGCPIFIALGATSLAGIIMVSGTKGLFLIPASILSGVESFLLVAVPLYILMSEALGKSGIGTDIYDLLEKLLYWIPGGLAIASIFACAIFGAMCGVSIAGVAAIGIVAVPEMLKRGYDRSLAAGAVTASGALAILIPPSISFILYGAMARVSVGKLFISGIIPGIILSCMMATYVLSRVLINPALAPKAFTQFKISEIVKLLFKMWPVIFLLAGVLGTIYTGVATPTEAGAIGAVGSLLFLAFRKKLQINIYKEVFSHTAMVTAKIMLILGSALLFSQFLNLIRMPIKLSEWMVTLQVPPIIIIILIMILFIALGMFIDAASLIIVTTPIIMPTVTRLGFDPLWFGVLMVLNLEIAVISPPVGLNLYTMKSIIDELSLSEILKGTLPYVIVELLALAIFLIFPELALWLPSKM